MEMVKSLYPDARDYTDVYDRCGLLGRRSLFGHGIHLSERECARLSETGSVVVHCPTSNTFLGSGLFDIGHLRDPRRPVRLAVASDVGGGTQLLDAGDAGRGPQGGAAQGPQSGGARGVLSGDPRQCAGAGAGLEIGSLEPGLWADIIVLDPQATPVLASRQELSESLEDTLFALMMLGDDRAIAATYVAGRCVHRRAPEKESR